MASSSQYYRVKRNTQTLFINSAHPNTETILSLKQRVCRALVSSRSEDAALASTPAHIDLRVQHSKDPRQWVSLSEGDTISGSGLVDQQIIAMVFKNSGGGWEDVFIAQPEALSSLGDLEDEPEELEATRNAKGKGRA